MKDCKFVVFWFMILLSCVGNFCYASQSTLEPSEEPVTLEEIIEFVKTAKYLGHLELRTETVTIHSAVLLPIQESPLADDVKKTDSGWIWLLNGEAPDKVWVVEFESMGRVVGPSMIGPIPWSNFRIRLIFHPLEGYVMDMSAEYAGYVDLAEGPLNLVVYLQDESGKGLARGSVDLSRKPDPSADDVVYSAITNSTGHAKFVNISASEYFITATFYRDGEKLEKTVEIAVSEDQTETITLKEPNRLMLLIQSPLGTAIIFTGILAISGTAVELTIRKRRHRPVAK
ncbi:MAG: hypothetical protein OEZ48_11465 [Candidatus Bathyarchaeota archaeon]|nr:hypothetical protein [Candidatus Bathyarchaeota archaeon]